MSFPAIYPGTCTSCGSRIHIGDLIHASDSDEGGWVHASCETHDNTAAREHPVCDVCWLTHPQGACDR